MKLTVVNYVLNVKRLRVFGLNSPNGGFARRTIKKNRRNSVVLKTLFHFSM